jgi:hypothetical protein
MTLSIMHLSVTISIKGTQHNDIQRNDFLHNELICNNQQNDILHNGLICNNQHNYIQTYL